MGLFAVFLSALFSSAKDLLSKRLAFRMDGTASTFASFAFALPYYTLLLAVLYLLGEETFTLSFVFLMLVFLRSVTDTCAEWMKMHAFGHGDISVLASFFSISPLFMLITSPLITGDELTVEEALAVILVVGGSVVLLYRPSATGWAAQRKGILLATGAAFFFSLNSCFDRLAVQPGTPGEAAALTLRSRLFVAVLAGFAMTLLSALFLMPFVLRSRERRQALRTHQGGLLLRGLLEIAFMVSKLYAIQYMAAPDVAGIQRISLLLSIVGGRVFFKEGDFLRRLAAGVLIVGGVFLIAWLQWQRMHPD